MQFRLPSTPLDTLNLSGAIHFVVKVIHTFADISGIWNRPAVKAAGDFEEMTLMDKIYWGYKSRKPLVKPQKKSGLDTFFRENREEWKNGVPLPDGFTAEQTLTFGGVGDLIKVDGLENSGDRVYGEVADLIFSKDIVYANLESQLSKEDVSEYVFSEKETPPLCFTGEQYQAVSFYRDGQNNDYQYNIMHTACNHTFDMGLNGLETTLEQLKKDNILDVGTNREAHLREQGRVFEKNGVKVGFVSATFGLNGKPVPEGKEYMVNLIRFHGRGPDSETPDMLLLQKQIEYCRTENCDVIIASLHWGYEYEFFPRPQQVAVARQLIEDGVDVVIGHHSHVLQPVEFYRPKNDPGRTGVIAYSLGNLTSSYSSPALVLSGILNFSIVKGTLDGKKKSVVQDVKLTPVVQVEDGDEKNPALRIETLDNLSTQWNDAQDRDLHRYLTTIKEYAALVTGSG